MAYTPPWQQELQIASWRGIEMHVREVGHKTGRRTAIHEYAYNDDVWVEDLGAAAQQYAFDAYLLGDDVASQYEEFKGACSQAGEGELIHPRLGRRTVALINSSFGEGEYGNLISAQLIFVETRDPAAAVASSTSLADRFSNFGDALDNISTASIGDFVQTAGDAAKAGQAAVGAVVETARGYVHEVQGVVRDATRAVGAVKPLANMLGVSDQTFGRFLAPLRSVSTAVNTVAGGVGSVGRANAGVTSLINGANKAAGVVNSTAELVTRTAASL